ncbi:thioredoxin family protein [Lentzea sp. NBC_00516]|uniref:thioredoxin family protein n=1 Tax=unclassified Lentzea TaxID=2643253 RepID=UPI002E819F78|nr:thioredoxin family protein [Lentzea sp. NBC_00516]WUD26498.1 thioredoxin family protein [Lentzea sp. NBC_00516]
MPNVSREVIALDVPRFQELIKTNDVVVIDISAEWCGPCQAFTSTFRDAAASYEDVVFASVDADEQLELGAAFNVKTIPTVAVMRAGALIFVHEGSLSEQALADVIRQARALDVEKVRQSVIARAATS